MVAAPSASLHHASPKAISNTMNPIRILSFLGLALFASAALADAAGSHRHVTVDGQGEVSVAPDRARLRLGVTQVSADLLMTESQVNQVVRDFLTAARSLGLRDDQIDSTGVNIQPEYVWDEKERNNRLVGYRVSRDIEVRVLKLDSLGEIMRLATAAGINQMQPPQLEYSEAREIQRQALVRAAQDARARAKLLAETLGMTLGPLHRLQATETPPSPPMPKMVAMRADMGAESGNAELGLSTGELRFSASVQAEFDLLLP